MATACFREGAREACAARTRTPCRRGRNGCGILRRTRVARMIPARRLEPEWLDQLPATDPGAIHTRRDLRRINALLRHPAIMERVLIGMPRPRARARSSILVAATAPSCSDWRAGLHRAGRTSA